MIEDFIDNPKGELRWFVSAFLVLGALTFPMWLALVVGASIVASGAVNGTHPVLEIGSLAYAIPPIGQSGYQPVVLAATFLSAASQLAFEQLFNQFFAVFAIIALFLVRNFLSAFRRNRPRLMTAIGIVPLLYFGSWSTFTRDYSVAGAIAIVGVLWAYLLPMPHSDERMGPWLKGGTVGLLCALFFQVNSLTALLSMVVAIASAGHALFRRHPIEAAACGIVAALPSLIRLTGDAADNGMSDTLFVLATAAAVAFLIGFAGIVLDTVRPGFSEHVAGPDEGEGDEVAEADASDAEADASLDPRTFGRHFDARRGDGAASSPDEPSPHPKGNDRP